MPEKFFKLHCREVHSDPHRFVEGVEYKTADFPEGVITAISAIDNPRGPRDGKPAHPKAVEFYAASRAKETKTPTTETKGNE